MDVTTKLRAACGHDSRSVDGCANCDAADEIDRLRAAMAGVKPLTRDQIWALPSMRGWFPQDHYRLEAIVRAVERAHGIVA